MPRFGWMRLTCLFLILSVLTALARFDGDAEARSLAAPVPDATVFSSEEPEPPVVRQWTEDQISSLQNVSEDALSAVGDPQPAEPWTRTLPSPKDAGREPVGRHTAGGEPHGVLAAEPPVFYRPAGPGEDAGSGPVCGDLSGAPEGGRIVFPLERRFFYSYDDTWGAPRTQGGHEGTDLMTPTGVPEYAITDGTVVPVAGSNADGWNSLGGHAVMVRADYSIGPVKAGDLFYYAHLVRESPLEIGDKVNAGQVVGYAGDTGQGPPGTSGLFPPHLHLGWYDATGDRQDADSGAMNPYPLLEWIKSNGGAVAGGSDARFCEAPRTGPPTPSAHDHPWPTPADPGLSPDLDTGSNDPKPSPAQSEAREKDPKPNPAAGRGARKQDPPAKKSTHPNRSEKQPQRDPDNAPAKPQNASRPQPAEPSQSTKPPQSAKPPQLAEPSKPPGVTDAEKPEQPPAPDPGSPPIAQPSEPTEDQYAAAAGTAPSPPTGEDETRTSDPNERPDPGKPPKRTARPTKAEQTTRAIPARK